MNIKIFCKSCRKVFILVAIMGICLLGGCVTGKTRQYKKDGLIIRFHSKTETGASGISQIKLNHPLNISENIVRNHLLSLRYKELTLIGKEKSIYSPKEVERIAPVLTKALNRVPRNKVLYHQFNGDHGKVAGEIFYSAKRINWRFHTIAGMDFTNARFRKAIGRKGQSSFWKLIPLRGQILHRSKNLGLSIKWENWILAKLKLPKVKVQPGVGTKNSKSLVNKSRNHRSDPQNAQRRNLSHPEMEKKLKFLKSLRNQNLIGKEEYDLKRKQLLDQLL